MQNVTRYGASMWRGGGVLALAIVMATVPGCDGDDDSGGQRSVIVFNGEGNRLNAYDSVTGARQTVIPSANVMGGRDINAQICFFPDGSRRFIAGEDTNQPNPPQGWGVFQLEGSQVGELSAEQTGKLSPTYQGGNDNAENYGCGFLSGGQLVTGDVGEQAMGPTNGQLIIWFPPFDRPAEEQQYCKLDVTIGTAGGIWIDADDRIYIASARGPEGGSVYRFRPPYPTSNDAAGGCGRVDDTGAPLADEVIREVFIHDERTSTASGIVGTPRGTFYVSSVFNGVIAEYDANGGWIDDILSPDETTGLPPYATGTPFGIGLASDGTIYYTDIGIIVDLPYIGPGNRNGTMRRIRFENGKPLPPETLDSELSFPDGIGILEE